MDKIPCIKCNSKLWEYINPYLKEWGYHATSIGEVFDEEFCILTLNWNNDITCYGFGNYNIIKLVNSEFINNVEEFLEKAAALKGFVYKRKDIMEINGIKIKPGMIITTKNNEDTIVWVVFQTKEELSVISYEHCSWYKLSGFVRAYMSKIDSIREMSDGCSLLDGRILWKQKTIITIQEIADKLCVSVDCIRIKGKAPVKCSFDKENLLPGMVVELNNNDYAMITYGTSGCLCLSGPNVWFPVECLNDCLEYTGTVITKVYSQALNSFAYKLDKLGRKLLWEREEIKILSKSDVAKLFNIPEIFIEIQ